MGKTKVLFTGYAPVHFLCFEPIYRRLRDHGGFQVHLSGGLRTKSATGEYEYDEAGMYGQFDVEKSSVVSTESIADRDYDLLFAANTKMILPRSVRTKVQIFHGISFRNKAVREENSSADYYFLVGPYMRRRFIEREMFSESDTRALPIGFPKTDRLLDKSLNRTALLKKHGLEGDRPVLLYAPTGQKKNSLETMGEDVIKAIAASDRYDLLIKLHDHPKGRTNWVKRLAPLEGPHTRLVKDLDVIPLLFLADLLITDASSVANEYALLDRPIVFLDVPELIQKAIGEGAAVDLDTWGRKGGLIVESPEEVVDAIDCSLAQPNRYSAVRRASVADLFYNPGESTNAAVDWILDFSATRAFLGREKMSINVVRQGKRIRPRPAVRRRS